LSAELGFSFLPRVFFLLSFVTYTPSSLNGAQLKPAYQVTRIGRLTGDNCISISLPLTRAKSIITRLR